MTHAATGAHTPTTENAAFEHYPLYCYHLSPTITQWCPLRACDIHELAQRRGFEGQDDTFFHLNHPIRWVRVVGVVVAVDQYYGRRVYTIDDGSGACIECVTTVPKTTTMTTTKKPEEAAAATTAAAAPEETKDPYADIDVGLVVDARGGLALYRQQKQIRVTRLRRLASTAAEVAFWHKIRAFAADVLARPWVVDARVRRRLEREARRDVVGDDDDDEAKAARKRRRRHHHHHDEDKEAARDDDDDDDGAGARKKLEDRQRRKDRHTTGDDETPNGMPPRTGNSLRDEARQRRKERAAGSDATPSDVPGRTGHSLLDEARKERRAGEDAAAASHGITRRTGNSLHDEARRRRKERPLPTTGNDEKPHNGIPPPRTGNSLHDEARAKERPAAGNDATPNDIPPWTGNSLRDEARQRRKERPIPTTRNDEKPNANGIPPRTGNSLLDEARRRRREKAERLKQSSNPVASSGKYNALGL